MERKHIALLAAFILVGLMDLFANALTFIPIIGGLAETLSEGIFEAIQVLLFGGLLISKK